MLIFIIPVKNKEVSYSWNNTKSLLIKTLKSILNQTSYNFKIIVASGHSLQIEDDQIKNSNKLKYITTNKIYKHNLSVEQKRKDKAEKLHLAFNEAIKYNPNYISVVDADDFISKNLVEYIENNKDNIGYCLNSGYVYDGNTTNEMFYVRKELSTFCGSTLIVKPELFKYTFDDDGIYKHFQNNHINGVPMPDIPFPSVIYNKGHGENFFPDIYLYGLGISCPIDNSIKDEFLFSIL